MCVVQLLSYKSTWSSDCGGLPESIHACICYYWKTGPSPTWEAYMSVWYNASNPTRMSNRHTKPHARSRACQWTNWLETETRSPANDPDLNESPWQGHCSCSQLLPKSAVETRVHWHSYLIQWSIVCDKLTNVDTFSCSDECCFGGWYTIMYFKDFH